MKQAQNQKFLKRLGFAQLILAVCAAVVCFLIAMLVQSEKIPENMGAVIAEVILEILVFLVCLVTAKPLPQNKLPAAILTAAAFALLRIIFRTIFLPEAQWGRAWGLILTGAAAVIAGYTASMKKQRRR